MKLNIQIFGGRGAVSSNSVIKKTLYHGSPNTNIDSFDISYSGQNTQSGEYGIYFTDSKEFADEFSYERIETNSMFFDRKGAKGKVYEAKINVNKPLDLAKVKDFDDLYNYASNLGKLDGKEAFISNMKRWQQIGNHQLMKGNLDLKKIASSKKYDVVIAKLDVQKKEMNILFLIIKKLRKYNRIMITKGGDL